MKKGDKKGSKLVDDLKATLDKEKKSVEKRLKVKQEKIDHLVAELNATRDSVGEKHSVADAAIRQTEEASARAEALEASHAALSEQLEVRDQAVCGVSGELELVREQLSEAEVKVEELGASAEAERKGAEAAREEAEAARGDVAQLQSKLSAQKDASEDSEAALRAKAEQMVGASRSGTREMEREVDTLQAKLTELSKATERAVEEKDNVEGEFVKYKTRSHVMLKKKEEELRKAVAQAATTQTAGEELESLRSKLGALKEGNDRLEAELAAAQDLAETASEAAAVAPAGGGAGGDDGGGVGGSSEELARVTRKLEGVLAREKSLTQDLAAMLEDSGERAHIPSQSAAPSGFQALFVSERVIVVGYCC